MANTKIILNDPFILGDLTMSQELGGDGALVRRGAITPGTLQVQEADSAGAQDRSILLKFDLTSIPPNATIVSAKLNLWLESADNALFTTSMRRVIYRMLKTTFEEATASWTNLLQDENGQSTSGDVAWGTAGAKQEGVDREVDPTYDVTGVLTVPHIYYEFEVGPAVEASLVDGVVGLLYERTGLDASDTLLETYLSQEGARNQNRQFGSQTGPLLVVEFSTPTAEDDDVTVPKIDYTDRDYQGLRAGLIRLLPVLNPEWTDYNPTNTGITILELNAAMADMLHYHLDRGVAERFPDTMQLRSSLVNLAKISGTTLDPAAPARVVLTLTLTAAAGSDMTIDAGSQFSASLTDGTTVTFETDTALTIPTGQVSGTVAATEGRTVTEDPVPGQVSNGTTFQEFVLSNTGYLADTLQVFLDDGTTETEWTRVESLATQTATAQVFEVFLDADDTPGFRFGDNKEGAIPSVGLTLRATYRIGGGARGNVGASTIDTVVSSGLPSGLTCTNVSAAIGGGDRQSLGSGRNDVFKFIRTNDRAVTVRDYGDIARLVQGVSKATARKNPDTLDPVDIEVIIAPNGGGQPTDALITLVTAEIGARKLEGIDFTVVGFTSVRLNLTATIRAQSTFRRSGVEDGVREALRQAFGFDTQDFGQTVRLSQVNQIIENVTGVDFVEIARFSRVPEATLKGWAGNATFSTIEISSTTKVEEWEVSLLSPTSFKVEGSVSGVQANTGTFDEPYATDNGEAAFTILSGSEGNAAGDRAVFTTSLLVGSVQISAKEIAERGQLRLTFTGGIT